MNKCKQCGCNIREGDMCQKCQREAEWLSKPDYFCNRSECGKLMPGATGPGICKECAARLPAEPKTVLCENCNKKQSTPGKKLCFGCAIKEGKERARKGRKEIAQEMAPGAKPCKYCGKVKKLAARGLCWKCYEDTAIRELYPAMPLPTRRPSANTVVIAADTIHASPAPEQQSPSNDETVTLRAAIAYYGTDKQTLKAAEEMAEAAAAIMRHYARDRKVSGVIEELADVEIMCRQMRMILGDEAIDKARAAKIARLAERLKNG